MKTAFKDYSIRDWEPRDRQAAAEAIATVLAEYGLAWDPEGVDRDALAVEACYLETGGAFWVVERGDRIVGTGGYYPIQRGVRAVEIRKMYLLPVARGQGLGRFLLQQLEAAIAADRYCQIWIETVSVLTEAVRLYEQNGYTLVKDVETPRCDLAYVKML
ncbi:GNAT family N-acetyltransferase [Altericista sp. CCNU0014]|uniref:GNAT family N-acetyltransferase n=1 Tax=Altericista sp. CCNU0014 TaxID=3082949 RepID=UPI00384D4F05